MELSTIAACMALSCMFNLHVENDAVATARPSVNTQADKDITGFFIDRIAGENEYFTDSKSLKLKEVADYREMVWNCWVDANNSYSQEEKLPALAPLSDATSGQWQLPQDLEPDAVMPFYWGTKGENESGMLYPMFVYLHGSGHKNAEWRTGLKLCQRFEDAPSVYFIPQIPNMGEYYRWWQKAKQYAWEKLLRLAFVSGHVDPDRVFFFGISEGGYGSQRLASFYADYLAGAGPMAGGEPLKNAPVENCAHISFSLRTGALDRGFFRNKLTSYTQAAFDELAEKHPGLFVHRIELIPGRGHSIDYAPTTPWLRSFVRNPYPKQVFWEDFEMDGLHRRGFYNIAVLERPAENERTYYEMQINGNEIDLKVENVSYTTVESNSGIDLKFERSYTPAEQGKFVVYLCDELVDLSKKVTLRVNGKKVFKGKVKPNLKHMVNSCATFFDPQRVYPAAIEVDLSKL